MRPLCKPDLYQTGHSKTSLLGLGPDNHYSYRQDAMHYTAAAQRSITARSYKKEDTNVYTVPLFFHPIPTLLLLPSTHSPLFNQRFSHSHLLQPHPFCNSPFPPATNSHFVHTYRHVKPVRYTDPLMERQLQCHNASNTIAKSFLSRKLLSWVLILMLSLALSSQQAFFKNSLGKKSIQKRMELSHIVIS